MMLEEVAELLTAYTMQKTRGAIKDMLSVEKIMFGRKYQKIM